MRKILQFIFLWSLAALLPLSLLAQTHAVSGTITAGSNAPVPGATIAVKDGAQTTSDPNGKFTIRVNGAATLTISALGYKTQTVSTGSADLKIKLVEDVSNLDEVIVTGLSTSIKRKNLANAVGEISATELNGVAPAQTLDDALEGKISGANINQNSGAPGGGVSIKLRGVTSIYGNTQPLYVIDGVYVDNTATSGGLNSVTLAQPGGSPTSSQDNPSGRIADLRPEDIASIEILKGASAAAIYGSRAAGGVIIITTKKGKQGKTNVTISQDIGVSSPIKLLGVRKFTAATAATLPGDSATLVNEFNQAQASGQIYDYEKEIYDHHPLSTTTHVSMNGGTENTDFYSSVSHEDDGGLVDRTGYGNTSVRLNLNHKINNSIKVSLSSNYINSSADRGIFGNDNTGTSIGIALSSTPDFAQLHPNAGIYPDNPFAASNPLQTVALTENNESVNRFIMGGTLEATLQKSNTSNTKFIANGGFDFYSLLTDELFPSTLQFEATDKGQSIQGFTKNLNTNFTLSLVNTYAPSTSFTLTSSVGLTQETGNYNNLLDVASEVISGQSNVSQAGALTATQTREQFLNGGLFLQEEALIVNSLTLTGGLRLDQSSNNGDVDKYYLYPKAGVSWNLTDMGLIKPGVFESVKLRAAYGQANNVPAYGSKFSEFGVSNISGNPGLLVSSIEGNPDIKPERQTEFETGVDFSLLKGRLGFELTYYAKDINDFLLLTTPPPSSGFAEEWTNAGNLTNHGVELGMNARPVERANVVWNTSVNFWLNRSDVTQLLVPPVQLGSLGGVLLGTYQIQQGKSATQIVGVNGTGGIGVLGNAEPRFQMSTYNEITFYKNWSLRFLVHWKFGGQNVDVTYLENVFGGTSADYDKTTKSGLPYGVTELMQVGVDAQQTVENSSYLRFREIGLYYTIRKLPVSFIKTIDLGVSLHNFFTITNYRGYDPEESNFGTGFSQGVDVDPYPSSKEAALHVSLNL